MTPKALALVVGGFAATLCGGFGCGSGDAPPSASDAVDSSSELASPAAAESSESGGIVAAPLPSIEVENLVLITIDTLRADRLGFAGHETASTPWLDRLASAGWVFDYAHSHGVMTLPTHTSILTGRLPYEHGVRDNSGFVLSAEVPTAATLLGAAGFSTAAVVGAFPLDRRYGLARGFDLYDDAYPEGGGPGAVDPQRPGSEVVGRGLEWWRDNVGKRRYLWLHLYDPHAPYTPPADAAARAGGDAYDGEVTVVDDALAPLLSLFLDGEEPSTLIVVTSDHGEALGEHGEVTHGLFAYEPTLRVPLVLWAPGLGSGRSSRQVRHVDLLPTMLEAAGVEASGVQAAELAPGAAAGAGELAGTSLFEPPSSSTATYFEAITASLDRGWAPLRGVVRGSRKFIELPITELYDLSSDTSEKDNLAPERPEEVAGLRTVLPPASAWPPERGSVSAEEERKLRSLGYLGGSAAPKKDYTADDDPKRLVHLDRQVHTAIDRYHRGRLDEAERLLRGVLAERPDMGVASYYLAQTLLEDGRLNEAVEVMSRAQRRGSATTALRRQLGLSLGALGRFDEAIDALEPLAEAGETEAMRALGQVLSDAGRLREAEAILNRIFEIDSRSPEAHETLALNALRAGDWPTAQRQARLALDLNDRLDQSWNYLGSARYQLGDRRGAFEAWRRAVEQGIENFDALYNLAIVARELGESDAARSALRRFLAGAPRGQYGEDLATARRWLDELGG